MENREKIQEAYEALGLDWSFISLFIDFSNGFTFKNDLMSLAEAVGEIEKDETQLGVRWRPASLTELFPVEPVKKTMLEPKTWQEFRNTGLFFFVNLMLQAMGWSLVVEVDKESGEVTKCYPARTKFRGFTDDVMDEEHVKIANYLAAAAPGFPEDIK